jgi:hypothetical protein
MLYTIQRLCGKRIAVVLVERRQLAWDQAGPLISSLQDAFRLPVMLVARDSTEWNNVKAVAEFDAIPKLLELLALEHIDWNEEIISG